MFADAPLDVRLLPGSPAISTGPNGLDMGARVPDGASISGEPPTPTRETNAVLTVGGPGITHYRYRVNDDPLGGEHPIAEPIRLAKLAPGETLIEVIGKNSAGCLAAAWPSESLEVMDGCSKPLALGHQRGARLASRRCAGSSRAVQRQCDRCRLERHEPHR